MRTPSALLMALPGLLAGTALAQLPQLEDALDAPGLNWSTSTDVPWFGESAWTHDGVDAAQSGVIMGGHTQSWIETTVTGRVAVTFWAKVDSDPGYSTLFLVTNGVPAQNWTSSLDWFPGAVVLDGGTNTLRWRYAVPGSDPSNWGGNRAWLDEVVVTDVTGLKPTFVVQPPSAVVLAHNHPTNVQLRTAVIGEPPLACQWQRSGTNLPGTWPIHFATTPNLQLSGSSSNVAGEFRLIVTNVWGAATSAVCTVSVVPSKPLLPENEPQDVVVASGAHYSLGVGTQGTPPFGHQWWKDGVAVLEATNSWIRFPSFSPADEGGYRVVITNAQGGFTSRVAHVTLGTARPTVTYGPEPASRQVEPGEWAGFEARASGPQPIDSAWERPGDPAFERPGDWLSFDPAASTDTGLYRLVARNSNGAVGSRVCVLAVSPATVLGVALDAAHLRITNESEWQGWEVEGDPRRAYDGLCAVRSPGIGDWDSSAFSTVVAGPTRVSFWWRISAGEQAHLEVAVDGSTEASISGEKDWTRHALDLPPGEHTLAWRFRKEDAGQVREDAAWVDGLLVGDGGQEITSFHTGGNSDWYRQSAESHDGVEAWRSGALGEDQHSYLATTVTGPGTLSFWWRVDSHESDRLVCRVDGEWREEISGVSGWQQVRVQMGPGVHAVEWEYGKDGSGTGGEDAGWVDEVVFTPEDTSPAEPPAFVLHPEDTLVSVGETLGLQVQASGSLPMHYTLWHEGSAVDRVNSASDEPGTLTRFISSPAASGAYWATAVNAYGAATSAVAQVMVRHPATIHTQPQGRTILRGRDHTLAVVAHGDPPLSYQWYKDGVHAADATAATLPIREAAYRDTGDYQVAVSNRWQCVTSVVARVIVTPRFYSIQNLGVLGTINQATSEALDINSQGSVVGITDIDEWNFNGVRRYRHGFLRYQAANQPHLMDMEDLGDGRVGANVAATNRLAGNSGAYSISDRSEIAGFFEYRHDHHDGHAHAAFWRPIACGVIGPVGHCGYELFDVAPYDLRAWRGSTAVAVNDRRQILIQTGVGVTYPRHGCLLLPYGPRNAPLPGFLPVWMRNDEVEWIVPAGLNNLGLVVGRYAPSIWGDDRPFVYDGAGHYGTDAVAGLDLGALCAVNDRGTMVGYVENHAGISTPFLVRPNGQWEVMGLMMDEPKDINNHEQVVGQGVAGGLLGEGGRVFRLSDLLVGTNGVHVLRANAINDRGLIVGAAYFNGKGHFACLLTPVGDQDNHPPVAVHDELRLPGPMAVHIAARQLLANDHDPDGDDLRIVALGDGTTTATAAGGTAMLRGGSVFYTPPSGPAATDTFTYTVSDLLGGEDPATLTLVWDPAAPLPPMLIHPPERLSDGTVRLSGRGPDGAVVTIYVTPDVAGSYWERDSLVVVPPGGQWTAIRPGTAGGQPAFYRAEYSELSP